MRIIQLVPVLLFGDAVGNNVIALDKLFKREGYESYIYSEGIHSKYKNLARLISTVNIKDDDIIIYHMSIGWSFTKKFNNYKCKKIAIYHNITPSHFYKNYHKDAYLACKTGIEEVKSLNKTFDYCIADSEFNKNDLISYGYTCRIDVIPILIAFDDYKKQANQLLIDRWRNTKGANILFVGRIVPNKKIEDLISTFFEYKKYYDKDAKLFIVGSYSNNDLYYRKLAKYIEILNLSDVYFSGHIKFEDILAYYNIADLFLCLSEHEGFCVPLAEAMVFKVPIIAYNSCAIGETLGGAGVLLEEKDPLVVAAAMNYVLKDKELISDIKHNQEERLKDFDNNVIEQQFMGCLRGFLKEK